MKQGEHGLGHRVIQLAKRTNITTFDTGSLWGSGGNSPWMRNWRGNLNGFMQLKAAARGAVVLQMVQWNKMIKTRNVRLGLDGVLEDIVRDMSVYECSKI